MKLFIYKCRSLHYNERTQRETGKIRPALTNNAGLFVTSSNPRASRLVSSFTSSDSDRRGTPRSLRIIVADDDRDQVLTLMMLLRDEGHEVQGVYSGSRVLSSIREFDPDVVLLDIAMPEKSGYQIAEEIRKRPRGQRVLLIGISGQYKQTSDKILAQLNGFDHYLVKPFDTAALLALLAPLSLPNGDR
jgi:CheY-like chemotaxis protein